MSEPTTNQSFEQLQKMLLKLKLQIKEIEEQKKELEKIKTCL
jgi:hypothetical protein